MLYRKAPANPTRMLLSVVAAGLAAGGCSGSITEGPAGSVTVPDDAQADGAQSDDASPGPCGGVCGVAPTPVSGSSGGVIDYDSGFCCGSSPGGIVGIVGFVGGGSVANPDGGFMADACGGVCGSVDASFVEDTGTTGPCGGVCGTVIAPHDAGSDH